MRVCITCEYGHSIMRNGLLYQLLFEYLMIYLLSSSTDNSLAVHVSVELEDE